MTTTLQDQKKTMTKTDKRPIRSPEALFSAMMVKKPNYAEIFERAGLVGEIVVGEVLPCGLVAMHVDEKKNNLSIVETALSGPMALQDIPINGNDAYIDKLVRESGRTFNSPEEAVSALVKIDQKKTTPTNVIILDPDAGCDVRNNQGNPKATIDIIDEGGGRSAREMVEAFLTSGGDKNSIDKRHSIGRFGIGGLAVLTFCDSRMVACRAEEDNGLVAFTIAWKCFQKGSRNYCYVALRNKDGSIPLVDKPLSLNYNTSKNHRFLPKQVKNGTLIRLVNFEIPGFASQLSMRYGNLENLLNWRIFGNPMPFRLFDLRSHEGKQSKSTTYIRGGRRALDDIADETNQKTGNKFLECILKKQYSIDLGVGSPEGIRGQAAVRVWSLKNTRKDESRTTDYAIDPNRPGIVTCNGQTMHAWSQGFLTKVGLANFAKNSVVEVDLSGLDDKVLGLMIQPTRNGLKSLHDELLRKKVAKMLVADPDIQEVESEIRRTKLESSTKISSSKKAMDLLKKLFNIKVGPKPRPPGGAKEVDPIPCLPFEKNKVTLLEFYLPKPKKADGTITLPVGEVRSIGVMTDAHPEYDRRGNIKLLCPGNPSAMIIPNQSDIRNGRKVWQIQANGTPGGIHEFVAEVRNDAGKVLKRTTIDVLFALPKTGGQFKSIRSLDIIPFNLGSNKKPIEDYTDWVDHLDSSDTDFLVGFTQLSGDVMTVGINEDAVFFRGNVPSPQNTSDAKQRAFAEDYRTYIAADLAAAALRHYNRGEGHLGLNEMRLVSPMVMSTGKIFSIQHR
jgi:hypothetical protein